MGLFGGIGRAFESEDTKKARQMLATRPIFREFARQEAPTVSALLAHAKVRFEKHMRTAQDINDDMLAKRRPYSLENWSKAYVELCLSMLYGSAATGPEHSTDAVMRKEFEARFREVFGKEPAPASRIFDPLRMIPPHPILDYYVPGVRTGEMYIQACRARADQIDAEQAQHRKMRAALANASTIILEYRLFGRLDQSGQAPTAQRAYEAAMSCSVPNYEITGVAVTNGHQWPIFKVTLDVLGSQSQTFFNGWTPDSQVQEYNHFEELDRQRNMGL